MKDYSVFAEENRQEYVDVLQALTEIPSPSNKENRIAKWIRELLCGYAEKSGYDQVHIYEDDICNVYCELGEAFEPGSEGFAVTAHTDTVFPDMEGPLPFERDGNGRIYGLGIKDNRANICSLLFCAKYIFEEGIVPEKRLLFVFNVCEEGTGNLVGSKRVLEHYPEICRWIAFDLDYTTIFCKALGSVRYKITITGQGGHSYNDFGRKNAIVAMSELIRLFYQINPEEYSGAVTYNVGRIQGGTTVNAIAEECQADFEIRSDDSESLGKLQEYFDTLLEKTRQEGAGELEVKKDILGIRPSMGGFSEEGMVQQIGLVERISRIIREITGKAPDVKSGSTDCNVPLSRGIPSICIGTCLGAGEHTRQEYIEEASLKNGLIIALKTVLEGIR